MRLTPLFVLLFLSLAAYGQQTSVAVLPSDGNVLSPEELEALTDEMRETALKVLPTNDFVLVKQDVVVKRLGGAENYIKECSESTCIVNLGKKAMVDYVAQASVIKLGDIIRLKVELYDVRTEGLVGMLNDDAENFRDLLAIVKDKAPEVFGKIQSIVPVPEPTPALVPEPTPVPEDAVPKFEPAKPKHTKVAVALDIAGVVLISAGLMANTNMQNALDRYGKRGQPQSHYNDTWQDVKSNRSARNIRYVAGGVALISGIGVHIWF